MEERVSIRKIKRNEYFIKDDIVFVKYSNCNEYFICDLEYWNYLKNYTWFKDNNYPRTNIGKDKIFMHEIILTKKENEEIDHIYQISNGVVDNRKNNLRIVTKSQNHMNQTKRIDNITGKTGVSYRKDIGKWRSRITVCQNTIDLGTYNSFEDAVNARLEAEEKYFGEFRNKNEVIQWK